MYSRMDSNAAAPAGMRSLGLVADPFLVEDDGSANSAGIRLAVRSAQLRLLSALDAAASDETHRPLVVEKPSQLPAYYPISALAGVLKALADDDPVSGLLTAYLPLDMMRVGRVRSALNVIAERVGGVKPDISIALWSRQSFVEPDTALPEWKSLAQEGVDMTALIAEIDGDPAGFSARVFGELVESREGAEDFETLMRVSTSRQNRLEKDLEAESDDAVEFTPSAEDPLAEVLVTPLGEVDTDALTEGSDSRVAAVGDYVIAYTKEHLSPVVARGIKAYRAQGFASMAEELKITKAPTKTLVALLRFVRPLYRSGALIYDRLEMWENVPADLRGKIVASLTELRWALKDYAPLVLILVPGAAPELEEAFSAARRIDWSFSELEQVREADAQFDAEVARGWLKSATVDGSVPAWADRLLAAVPAGTLLDSACAALSWSLARAADAGLSEPEPADVVVRLDRMKEDARA